LQPRRHDSIDRSDPARDASSRETLDVAALTRSMVEGDDMAYRIFYDAYFDRLSRYLLVVTRGDEHATREALQKMLTRVVRHIRVFSDEAVFWSWLTVLARSALADEGRKRRRYLAFLDRFKNNVALDQHPASGEAAEGSELAGLLERNLNLLPADERALLEEKYFARRSVRDIAARLQTTEKAIESRLTRVRSKLKAAILGHLNHEPPA
jgi:RNA polymerase sigma-70 factor (ECF subfamily)